MVCPYNLKYLLKNTELKYSQLDKYVSKMDHNNSEFINKEIKQIQNDYFMNTLPIAENCNYYYEKKGLNPKDGDLILFQMNNTIIASTIYESNLKEKHAILIKKDAIKVFKPITYDELAKIIDDLHKFDSIKRRYDISNVDMEQLNTRMSLHNS